MKHLILILILGLLALTGCATTYPMKVSRTRAFTDLAVTGLIDNKILSKADVLLIVEQLRAGLDELENVPEYTAQVHAVLAPYIGGQVLGHFLLKTLPKHAFKLESYRHGLTQALNQAAVAATQYRAKRGGSP